MHSKSPVAKPTLPRALGGLEQRVLTRYRRLGLAANATIVVGFSGGADSLALAGILRRIAGPARLRPILVHIDHGLRPSSVVEAAQARRLAEALDLPFRESRIQADPRSLHPGVGLEEAARRERYLLLAEAIAATDAAALALAHHQDDQAETVLLHLLRGAGVTGASGMAELTTLLVPWWHRNGEPQAVTVWRPLLAEPRSALRRFAQTMNLPPVDDPSNLDREARRNAIRHDVLPLLEQIMPGATGNLARFGYLASDDDTMLETVAAKIYDQGVTASGELRRRVIIDAPTALQRRVVRRWLGAWSESDPLSAERTDALVAAITRPGSGRRVEIGHGVSVVIQGPIARVERAVCVGEGEAERWDNPSDGQTA